jgi:hypothetical protein
MEGLEIGRIVHYVMKDGQERPLMVVRVWSPSEIPGYINGVLIFDGSNDSGIFPYSGYESGRNTAWITSTHYDAGKKPGTWHWPKD